MTENYFGVVQMTKINEHVLQVFAFEKCTTLKESALLCARITKNKH